MMDNDHVNIHEKYENHTAIIIGGGIGGLCAAIALKRLGFAVQVYEQSGAVRDLGAGLAIWPNALQAFDHLGIGDKIRAQAVEDISGGIFTWNGHPLFSMSAHDLKTRFGASVLIVHRAELHTLLLEALPAGTVQFSKRCTGFTQTSESVTATFDDASSMTASLLIGADGLRSVIRPYLVPNSQVRYSGYTAWRCVVGFEHKRVVRWGEFWGSGKRFGVAPVSNDRVYLFCTANFAESQSREANPEARKAQLLGLFKGWSEPIPTLLTETDASAILNNDISDLDPLPRWCAGRVALLGDAAHAMTPNLGQGACQAVEDAVILAHCLSVENTLPAALRTYEQKRLPRTQQIVLMSRRFGQVAQWENPLGCQIRDFVMSKIPGSVRMNALKPVLTFRF
jgi:2-polyprenyl-6-methoxyphenol hydroxylase-like FAD-dependent oxidoreductase